MAIRKNIGSKAFDIFNIAVLIILSCCFIIPFIHILCSSLTSPVQLYKTTGILLWPKDFTLNGYLLVFKNKSIYTGYINSLIYVGGGTFLCLMFTSSIAYVLSRKNVFWNKTLMFLIVFTMFFSGGLIPFYLQVKGLGLYNSHWAILLPDLIIVFYMIIMRTSFLEIPDSLEESAKIDGAGHLTILFKIILPVSKAVLSVVGLFYAVHFWNLWFNAAIFLQDRKKYPIQLIMREILILQDQYVNQSDQMSVESSQLDTYLPLVRYSTIIVATIPILFAYPFVQKHFTKGVMLGSIKG